MRHTDKPSSCDNLLEDGLEQCKLPGYDSRKDEILFFLKNYIREIELFNKAYGLVKVENQRELVVKHILDSLAPLPLVLQKLAEQNGRGAEKPFIADVGSGAGLPGIPLAICLPGADFTLIERMGRRAGFLRNCAAVLGLPNIRVEETEMEQAAANRFSAVVFRAFRPLEPDILKGLLRLLRPNGFLAAWKGRYAAAAEEMANAEKAVPGLVWEIAPLKVPFLDEERHLVLINNPATN